MTSTMDEATLASLGTDMNKGYETLGDKFSFATKWDFSDLVQNRDSL
jgi:hypothetical protein